jgi:hypothetical protein
VRTIITPSVVPSGGPETVKTLAQINLQEFQFFLVNQSLFTVVQEQNLFDIRLLLFENNFLLRSIPNDQVARFRRNDVSKYAWILKLNKLLNFINNNHAIFVCVSKDKKYYIPSVCSDLSMRHDGPQGAVCQSRLEGACK